ncbi:MAG: AMP-binding protein [Polyangiaceae bacterium]|nr:AMP-binding protein [Polyangiaceae bacterium]
MSGLGFNLAATWTTMQEADRRVPLGGRSPWRLAAGVRAAAGGEESIVVVGHDRRLYAAALLASLVGGPRVIVPHAFSTEALTHLRSTTPARCVLGATTAVEGLHRLSPVDGADALPDAPTCAPGAPILALHTGGSTGRSRLFWKSAENLLGEATVQTRMLAVDPGDVIFTCVPPNHIYGLLFSVLVPLLSGARVVAPEAPYPEDIAASLVTERATLLVAVPPHYHALATARLDGHRLRAALCSAAPLDAGEAARFRTATGVAITEIYGSTETGGIATRSQGAGQREWRAIDGVTLRVAEGRLWVRSAFLSAELRDGSGGFLTADRVAPGGDPDSFELLGRVDGVVKVGGVRVELADVQAALLQVPGVTDAHVLAREVDGARAQELVALFVGAAEPVEVRRGLASRLEAVAVPRVILKTARIPSGANGKIERGRVLELLAQAGEGDGP